MAMFSAKDARANVVAAFFGPPVVVCVTWLLTRVAIHYSAWGVFPLFLLVSLFGAAVCIGLAVWFAVRETGWWAVARFFVWVVCSVTYTAGGLGLVDLLPISVGDGP